MPVLKQGFLQSKKVTGNLGIAPENYHSCLPAYACDSLSWHCAEQPSGVQARLAGRVENPHDVTKQTRALLDSEIYGPHNAFGWQMICFNY